LQNAERPAGPAATVDHAVTVASRAPACQHGGPEECNL